MPHFELTTIINKPLQVTFAYFVDREQFPQWRSGIVEVEALEGDATSKGSQHRLTLQENGPAVSLVEVVTDCRKDELVSYTIDHPSVCTTSTTSFEAIGNSTKVTTEVNLTLKSLLWKALGGMIRKDAQQRYELEYQTLKELVEND